MSFYGTIYHQISNAFEHIYIKNSGKNKNNDFNEVEETIKADGREGEICFDTGNRWILLEGDSVNNYCKISHNKSDSVDNSTKIIALKEVSSIASDKEFIDIKLDNDSFFELKNPCYDKAGHISGTNTQYIKLNRVDAEAEMQDMRDDIKAFKDDVNDTIKDFEDGVNDTLKDFEDRLIDQEAFEKRVKDLEDIDSGTRLKNIEDFMGEHELLTTKEDVTLCGSIGKIDYLRNGGKDSSNKIQLKQFMADLDEAEEDANTNTLSICDYINVLKQEIKTLKNRCDRLDSLVNY